MVSLSILLGYVAPLLVLWLTLIFWSHYDASGIDLRRDRRNLKHRSDFRAGIRWPVSVETAVGSAQGRTKNVSASGATLVSLQPLIRGEIVPVVLRAPDRVLRLRGEVMWIDTFYPGKSRTPRKAIGVLFRGLSEEDRHFLEHSVEKWREAEERGKAEAPPTSLFARWLGRGQVCFDPSREVRGGLRLEVALHWLRQRVDGVLCHMLALFRPYRAAEAPARSRGKRG